MTHPHHPHPQPRNPVIADLGIEPLTGETTAASIKPLSNDIVALCLTSAYDDMSWAQIDRALTIASAKIKLLITQFGTLNAIQTPPA